MKRLLIFISVLLICSCSETNKKEDEGLIYYAITNETLKQQICNYADSVDISDEEKMLCVYLSDLGYDDNEHQIVQYSLTYEICAFNLIFEPIVYAKIDTLIVAVMCQGIRSNFILSDDDGWKYLKNTFKKDYQYYLDSIKTGSEVS